jgi:hypothetical protein
MKLKERSLQSLICRHLHIVISAASIRSEIMNAQFNLFGKCTFTTMITIVDL